MWHHCTDKCGTNLHQSRLAYTPSSSLSPSTLPTLCRGGRTTPELHHSVRSDTVYTVSRGENYTTVSAAIPCTPLASVSHSTQHHTLLGFPPFQVQLVFTTASLSARVHHSLVFSSCSPPLHFRLVFTTASASTRVHHSLGLMSCPSSLHLQAGISSAPRSPHDQFRITFASRSVRHRIQCHVRLTISSASRSPHDRFGITFASRSVRHHVRLTISSASHSVSRSPHYQFGITLDFTFASRSVRLHIRHHV